MNKRRKEIDGVYKASWEKKAQKLFGVSLEEMAEEIKRRQNNEQAKKT